MRLHEGELTFARTDPDSAGGNVGRHTKGDICYCDDHKITALKGASFAIYSVSARLPGYSFAIRKSL